MSHAGSDFYGGEPILGTRGITPKRRTLSTCRRTRNGPEARVSTIWVHHLRKLYPPGVSCFKELEPGISLLASVESAGDALHSGGGEDEETLRFVRS